MSTQNGGRSGRESSNRDYEERVVVDTRPCYVKYSLRGLGVFAGGLCLVFGILNCIFHPFNIFCLLFSIVLSTIGFFVATTEATGGTVRICYCLFFNKFPKASEWIDSQPLWVKPLVYILSPMLSMLICTTLYTVIGGGAVIVSGVAYAISVFPSQSALNNQNNQNSNAFTHQAPRTAPSGTAEAPTATPSSRTQGMFTNPLSNRNQISNPTIIRQPNSVPTNGNTFDTPTISKVTNNSATFNANPKNPFSHTENSNSRNNTTHSIPNQDRYENISVISTGRNGTAGNPSNPTNADYSMEMQMGHNLQHSSPFYNNVQTYSTVDLDLDGNSHSSAYPDNPFDNNTQERSTMNLGRRINDSHEYNC